MKKERMHVMPDYILNPAHPISVSVIGCGGTGSNVLQSLVALHLSLRALDHPGLFVFAFDDDKVTEANAARQLFYPMDVDRAKSTVLIERINRSYGLDWVAIDKKYEEQSNHTNSQNQPNPFSTNFIITCVDSVKARKAIAKQIKLNLKVKRHDNLKMFYWIDTGNGREFGQIIIGTLNEEIRKSSTYHCVSHLPTVLQEFPKMKDTKGDNEPSCSLAEALTKQDLYINKHIATYTCNLMWKMFRKGMIPFRGLYINLESLTTNYIPV